MTLARRKQRNTKWFGPLGIPWSGSGMTVGEKVGWFTGPRTPTGCREWLGGADSEGYAVVSDRQRAMRVCRWILGIGDDKSLVARHKCDNPRCVEPSHLEPGTVADNSNDAGVRGRRAVGEKNGAAKLSRDSVAQIRGAHGAFVSRLAREHGVTTGAIRMVLTRARWSHINE